MTYRAPHEIAAEIRAAKWAGKSLTDLEAEFDISRSTAVRYTRGVTVQAKPGRRAEHDHAKVIKLLEQGLTAATIKERLGISRAHVFRICKRYRGCTPSELLAHIQRKAA